MKVSACVNWVVAHVGSVHKQLFCFKQYNYILLPSITRSPCRLDSLHKIAENYYLDRWQSFPLKWPKLLVTSVG